MDEKLLYTLITQVNVAGKPEELYILRAELYVSHHEKYPQQWILQATLNGRPLLGAHWDFTTADFPPITLIEGTLAERIGRQLDCKNHEVTFPRHEWVGTY